MRSIFWIGCILAVLVSLLASGAIAESVNTSTVDAAVAQAENVTDVAKTAAANVGSAAAQAENITDTAKEAATAAGISGAENVTDSVKQVAGTVGAAADKVENVTDAAKQALATVGAKADEVANATGKVAANNTTNVTAPVTEPDLINDTLVKFVTDARTYAVMNGKADALATFNDRTGGFVKDKMYIFAYDFDGKALALPYTPGMVGLNQIAQTDSKGLRYVQQMRDTAKQGVGFVKYQEADMMNKGTVSEKVSYVTNVDGTYWIGAGVYKGKEVKPTPVVTAVKEVVSSVTDANATVSAENVTTAVKTVADAVTNVTSNVTA